MKTMGLGQVEFYLADVSVGQGIELNVCRLHFPLRFHSYYFRLLVTKRSQCQEWLQQ